MKITLVFLLLLLAMLGLAAAAQAEDTKTIPCTESGSNGQMVLEESTDTSGCH